MTVVCLFAAGFVGPPAAHGQAGADFRIVVIPDTQVYVETEAGGAIAQEQFAWTAAQAAATNTVFVTHVGDVVQNPQSATEWDRIEPGFAMLETAGLAYGISPGNHDLVPGGGAVEYDRRFPLSRWENEPWFGGALEGTRSAWQTVELDAHSLLFVHLRHARDTYGDITASLDWLDEVLADHPDHLAFVTTHEFTEGDGSVRLPAVLEVLQGRCTVALVLSGHRPGEAARNTFTDACGRTVHHVLTNYQFLPGGGQGYLRTLDIDPISLSMTSAVYSPTLDAGRTGADEAFTVSLAKLDPVAGDANCDRTLSIVDALLIAQFATATRADRGSCPLVDPTEELDTTAADRNDDGRVNIVDALLVARCVAQLPAAGCPD